MSAEPVGELRAFDWPPQGWTEHSDFTHSHVGHIDTALEVKRLDDGSYFASHPTNLRGIWGEGATPDEAAEDFAQAVVGCAVTFGGRRE